MSASNHVTFPSEPGEYLFQELSVLRAELKRQETNFFGPSEDNHVKQCSRQNSHDIVRMLLSEDNDCKVF